MRNIGKLVEIKGRMEENKARAIMEIATMQEAREYAATCKSVATAGVLYAVLNMDGIHMQDSKGRMLYAMETDGMNMQVAVSTERLENLGYTHETGWPCALLGGTKAPVYVDSISQQAIDAGVMVEAIADREQTAQRIEAQGNGKIGSETPVKDFTPVVHCETAGTAKQRDEKPREVITDAQPMRNPRICSDLPEKNNGKAWDAESERGQEILCNYAMDMMDMGVPRDAAAISAKAILEQYGIIRKTRKRRKAA